MDKTVILNHEDVSNKICRMAYQIYEDNTDEQEVMIMGIEGNGYALARKIAFELTEISGITIPVCKISMQKHSRLPEVRIDIPVQSYAGKSVVVVDDVLHTGKTLIYAVAKVLETPVKKLKTAVMIDRNHKLFPVKADYKGLSLSTSMKNHVEMKIGDDGMQVCLR